MFVQSSIFKHSQSATLAGSNSKQFKEESVYISGFSSFNCFLAIGFLAFTREMIYLLDSLLDIDATPLLRGIKNLDTISE